jgi:predicted ATPase
MLQEGNSETTERERVEALRRILEREQGRPVSFEEASEVAESLVSFYEVLGAEVQVEWSSGQGR